MGIRPWISKEYCHAIKTAQDIAALKLLVIVQESLTAKTQLLLNNIIAFLQVAEQDYQVVSQLDDALSLMEKNASLLVLAFGVSPEFKQLTHSMIDAESLEMLLNHPLSKKKLFMKCST